jgi:glutamate-1-semialdehyde 2,1-aminomutase
MAAATQALVDGMLALAAKHGIALCENHVCGMFSFFFGQDSVRNYEDVAGSNVDQFNAFFHAMLDQGIYLAPSAFEAGFLSTQHGTEEIQKTLAAADLALGSLTS